MNLSEPLIQVSLLGEAVDRGPVGILVADQDMRYVAANQFAADLLGYTRAEILGLRVPDVAAADSPDGDFSAFMRNRTQRGTATVRCKDGSELEIAYNASETEIAGMALYVSVFSVA
jgi:PAS domain S-box-containing protein